MRLLLVVLLVMGATPAISHTVYSEIGWKSCTLALPPASNICWRDFHIHVDVDGHSMELNCSNWYSTCGSPGVLPCGDSPKKGVPICKVQPTPEDRRDE